MSLGLEPAAARYVWWRGALAGILAGATFALTLAAVLPRSAAVPQTSRTPVKSVTNDTPWSAPALEDIGKKEVLVLPSIYGPTYGPTEPLASAPIAPLASEPIAPPVVEQSAADDWSDDLQNCVGCSNIYSNSSVPNDAGAQPDAAGSSDAQAQAPNAEQPIEVVQSPFVVVEPPPVTYFAAGAPTAFSFPPTVPPPGGLGMISPGFLGTTHTPAFGGMPFHR